VIANQSTTRAESTSSIPKRRELVKQAARDPASWEVKERVGQVQAHAWTHCALSDKPLREPIVSDYTGKLYNKEDLLQFLMDMKREVPAHVAAERAKMEERMGGTVRTLKDVVEVKFHAADDITRASAKWTCPMTGDEMGPGVKSVYLVPCGHAFSAAVVKELGSENAACPVCSEGYEQSNIIPILPTAKAQVDTLAARADKLKEQGLGHSLRTLASAKKRKNGEEAQNGKVGKKRSKTDRPAKGAEAKHGSGGKMEHKEKIDGD